MHYMVHFRFNFRNTALFVFLFFHCSKVQQSCKPESQGLRRKSIRQEKLHFLGQVIAGFFQQVKWHAAVQLIFFFPLSLEKRLFHQSRHWLMRLLVHPVQSSMKSLFVSGHHVHVSRQVGRESTTPSQALVNTLSFPYLVYCYPGNLLQVSTCISRCKFRSGLIFGHPFWKQCRTHFRTSTQIKAAPHHQLQVHPTLVPVLQICAPAVLADLNSPG